MNDFLVELKVSAAAELDDRNYERRKTIVDVSTVVQPEFAVRIAKELFALLAEKEAEDA